jgi:hypothetical protein
MSDMNKIAEAWAQMEDIEGLDEISRFWPLAPGWWAVIAIIVAFICFMIYLRIKEYRFRNSWRFGAWQELEHLERNVLAGKDIPTVVTEFPSLLKRIVIMKYARASCASLTGEIWLKWLESKDPKKFAWTKHGELLMKMPYAPIDYKQMSADLREELRLVIGAIKKWVR